MGTSGAPSTLNETRRSIMLGIYYYLCYYHFFIIFIFYVIQIVPTFVDFQP